MSRIEILQRQEQQEDTTPLSASSPRTTNAQSPRMSTAGKATLGYSTLIARQAYQVGVSEISARGNEELATNIQNITRGLTYASAIALTGGKALVPIAINAGVQRINQTLETRRENNMIEIQNRLRGQRLRVGGARD